MKYLTESVIKHAAAATGKSESTTCKMRKEANMPSCSGVKLSHLARNVSSLIKGIELDDRFMCNKANSS